MQGLLSREGRGMVLLGRMSFVRIVNVRQRYLSTAKRPPRRHWQQKRAPAIQQSPRDQSQDVQLTAQITRVTFSNPDNGYSVVRANVEGEAAAVTLCGTMHGVQEGHVLTVRGRWSLHDTFGEQLVISQSERVGLESLAKSDVPSAILTRQSSLSNPHSLSWIVPAPTR